MKWYLKICRLVYNYPPYEHWWLLQDPTTGETFIKQLRKGLNERHN